MVHRFIAFRDGPSAFWLAPVKRVHVTAVPAGTSTLPRLPALRHVAKSARPVPPPHANDHLHCSYRLTGACPPRATRMPPPTPHYAARPAVEFDEILSYKPELDLAREAWYVNVGFATQTQPPPPPTPCFTDRPSARRQHRHACTFAVSALGLVIQLVIGVASWKERPFKASNSSNSPDLICHHRSNRQRLRARESVSARPTMMQTTVSRRPRARGARMSGPGP